MIYKKILIGSALILTAALSTTAFAQNSRTINLSNFNSIGVNSGIDLHLSQGTTERIVIKGNKDLIKDVVVEKKNQQVIVKYKDGINWSRLFKNDNIDVYVTFKNLNSITASGGSDVDNTGVIKSDKFSITSSGGADIDLNITCNDISITTSGGSDVDLKGSAENMMITASGGSDISAYGFSANYAQVNSSGGADIDIYVNKGLKANASGGSDITYKGNAALKTNSSKSGSVTKVN